MSTAEYLRIHANAPPSKLRTIINKQIFVHDDVDYLKRLVKDLGGMDYVFRFLWYDGPVPHSRWNAVVDSCRGGASGSSERQSTQSQPSVSDEEATRAKQYGRTWIQYCCFHNAHQCLQWIFQEIVRNHLNKEQEYHRKQEHHRQLSSQGLTDVSSVTLETNSERQTDTTTRSTETSSRREKDQEDEEDDGYGEQQKLTKIIKQLLEFPSASYCGTNYMAVGECLSVCHIMCSFLSYLNSDATLSCSHITQFISMPFSAD